MWGPREFVVLPSPAAGGSVPPDFGCGVDTKASLSADTWAVRSLRPAASCACCCTSSSCCCRSADAADRAAPGPEGPGKETSSASMPGTARYRGAAGGAAGVGPREERGPCCGRSRQPNETPRCAASGTGGEGSGMRALSAPPPPAAPVSAATASGASRGCDSARSTLSAASCACCRALPASRSRTSAVASDACVGRRGRECVCVSPLTLGREGGAQGRGGGEGGALLFVPPPC